MLLGIAISCASLTACLEMILTYAGFAAFLTLSMLPLCAQPALSTAGILNASGYQNQLAPDTVFVIFGSGLGPAAIASASAPNYPISVGGTSVTFTPAAGGTGIPAKMIYSIAGQIAGLLPSSSIAPGTYAVTVTYNSQTSQPQNVMVVAHAGFGIATVNSAGTGPAQATIGNVNAGVNGAIGNVLTSGMLNYQSLSLDSSAVRQPGDTLVLWGTGGGDLIH